MAALRLARRRRSHGLAMDMTPMIDVVFLLLIFFMTVSQQSFLDLEPLSLPQQRGAQDKAQAELTLNLSAQDDLILSGDKLDLVGLRPKLDAAIATVANDPTRVTILIRVDANARSALLNQVLLLLRERGIVRCRIAVQSPGD